MSRTNIIEALSRVGIGTLEKVVGRDRLARLSELGVPMRSRSIAEMAFQEQGYSLLKDFALRRGILNSLSQEQLSVTYEINNAPHDPNKLAKFQWGQNSATQAFLSLFGISLEEAFPAVNDANSFSTQTQIEKPLFDYQNSIRKQLVAFLESENKQRIIAHMPTGSGKTRTTMELISDFIRTRHSSDPTLVVWMAHSDELCEQAVQSFTEIWSKIGCENANIYRFWGGLRGDPIDFSKPILIVTSFQSCHAAILSKNDDRFAIMASIRSECDLLIVDEAHMSVAPTYKQAIEFLCNTSTRLIGLTATPGRHHIGGDVAGTTELADFYQNNKITLGADIVGELNPIEFLQSRGILSVVERYRIDSGVDISLSPRAVRAVSNLLELPAEVLRELGESATRTSMVASQALILAIDKRKQTIVFCPTKENAVDLAIILQTRGCKARAITGDTSMSDRRTWIEDFKDGSLQVLTNFGVLTTGFDAPNIEAVIIARPTTSVVLYSQMVGRGLRGANVGGSESCILVDVIDNIQNLPDIPQAFTYFDDYFGDENANR